MQGSVRKKRDEVDLWEIVSAEGETRPRRKPRPQYDVRESDIRRRPSQVSGHSRQSRQQQDADNLGWTVQIIGQEGHERYVRSRRQSRQPQSGNGRSRAVQVIGEEEYEKYERPRRQNRQPQSGNGRGRAVQVIGEEEYERYERPRRQNRQSRSGYERSHAVQVIGEDEYERPRRKSKQAYIRQRERAAYLAKRKKARKRRALFFRMVAFAMIIGCMALVITFGGLIYQDIQGGKGKEKENIPTVNEPVIHEADEGKISAPPITADFLEINEFSRPGTALNEINSIFVHYTANPGTSAAQNRSYFANLAETQERSASAHYIIGYEGEIVQCIPLNEQAYAVMTRNEDSISIECCYLEKDGQFTQETYDSLVHMLAWLLQENNLSSSDILRHYDCGGKRCPLYFVEHEDAWAKLLADVEAYIEEHTQIIDAKL